MANAEKERGCDLEGQSEDGPVGAEKSSCAAKDEMAIDCKFEQKTPSDKADSSSAEQETCPTAERVLLMDEAAQLHDLTIIDDDEKTAKRHEQQQQQQQQRQRANKEEEELTKQSLNSVVKTENSNEANIISGDDDHSLPVQNNNCEFQRENPDSKESSPSKGIALSVDESHSKIAIKPEMVLVNTKLAETDSLILTADDELETEMAMTDKNDKVLEDNSASHNSICEAHKNYQQLKLKDPKHLLSKESPKVARKPQKLSGTNNESETTNVTPMKPTTDEEAFDFTSKIVTSFKQYCNNLKSGIKKPTDTTSKRANTTADSKKRNCDKSRVVWVSNVDRITKASDLKQFVSCVGNVLTAKIVTDGKNCYGYLVMDSTETASECVKQLDGKQFESKKVHVSSSRPTPPKEDVKKVDSEKIKKEVSTSHGEDRLIRSNASSKKIKARRLSNDPLTTRFDSARSSREEDQRSRSSRSRRSPSNERYVRERKEHERLKRRVAEEHQRNRELMRRQMEREEEQREIVFKLRQEQKKLELDRELFERERRELSRLDAERRKIERERMEVLKQKAELAEELEKSRLKTKIELEKAVEKQKFESKCLKTPTTSSRSSKGEKDASSAKRSNDTYKYDRQVPPPPPPKLDNFDLRKNIEHSKRRYDYGDGGISKSNCESSGRKIERESHQKIEVIDRKFYGMGRTVELKHHDHDRSTAAPAVRKIPNFDDRRGSAFVNRSYNSSSTRDVKRFKNDHYLDLRNPPRNQWQPSVNSNEVWKMGFSNSTLPGSSMARFQVNSFSATYGVPANRTNNSGYHHPPSSVPDYHRYGGLPSITGRKY